MTRKCAGGWQPFAGSEPAIKDAARHKLLNARLQGSGLTGVEEEVIKRDHATDPDLG
jgi:hypothetical protein